MRPGIRRRLLLVVVATVAIALIALVAGFNIVLAHTLDGNARDLVRARATAQAGSIRTRNGHVVDVDAPDGHTNEAYVWVFDGPKVIEQPRVTARVTAAAIRLTHGPSRYLDLPSVDTRLYSKPVLGENGRRVGTIVAGVSLGPYEDTRQTVLVASIVFGGLMLIGVGATAWLLLGAALHTVVRMTRQAAAWSDHDLDHRFALGEPHDELTELGATLDSLLDRLAASLRHERLLTAEISHELRTPLAGVLAESEYVLRRDRSNEEYQSALRNIHTSARQLSRTIDTLVAAARYESRNERGTTDARSVALSAVGACAGLAADRSVQVDVAATESPLRVGVDASVAERILQPVIENACLYGAGHVRITFGREGAAVVVAVEDDGPGITDDERERIFEPGVRGHAGNGVDGGSGLGLPLARRLARSVRGEIDVGRAARGGQFVIRLPAG